MAVVASSPIAPINPTSANPPVVTAAFLPRNNESGKDSGRSIEQTFGQGLRAYSRSEWAGPGPLEDTLALSSAVFIRMEMAVWNDFSAPKKARSEILLPNQSWA